MTMLSEPTFDLRKTKSLLFMKVGDHAGETWEQVIKRKRQEKKDAGMIFWGYGGSACHPLTQVRPFVKMSIESGNLPILVMQRIKSNWDQGGYTAEQYSEDGVNWKDIPRGIKVIGSRYAMVLDEVFPGDFMFDPAEFEVGIGPSRGKQADEYLSGRTDKACLVRSREAPSTERVAAEMEKDTGFYAKLLAPYAVMLR